MKYIQPVDQPTTPAAPYLDLDAARGVDGSIPPAKFFNNLQAELLNVITYAGITPSDVVLDQLLQAILALIPPPSGAPSDASLVHYAVDAGAANALIVSPSPTVAVVAAGLTIFCVPASDNSGAATLTVNLTPSGASAKNIKRADGSALGAGDIKFGRLTAFVFDGTNFRIAWQARVVSDGVTITGDGTQSNPLVAIGPPQGPGTEVGQWIQRVVRPLGSYSWFVANPITIVGQIVSGADIANGTIPGLSGALWSQTEEPYSNLNSYGSWYGPISGTWKCVGHNSTLPYYTIVWLTFVRIT